MGRGDNNKFSIKHACFCPIYSRYCWSHQRPICERAMLKFMPNLHERKLTDLQEMSEVAEKIPDSTQPLTLHSQSILPWDITPIVENIAQITSKELTKVCKPYGHKSFECRLRGKKRCFCCDKLGHGAREC